ncbi:MAG: butyrate kinase [Prolixibacteraceae bacterium]|jgi:butyrate kinase|nr:butyrate kinase [Prolixibacteraceae bacterium]MBT6767193.1 butyrate kinase [Prolixibacteraceae bacterium]MBT6997806.1 butyrate kinase [Prolixibacteraceae bacterium]MBT7396244.1 butyrate kinase [Prolixibacteraceae bacterium]
MHRILAINPGSTSTKFAVYYDTECVLNKTIRHSMDELLGYKNVIDQFDFRKGLIIDSLVEEGMDVDSIKFIIGRGGMTYPMESGVYRVNHRMLKHACEGIVGQHASNLGPMLADYIALQIPNAQAFIADPVVTDELEEIARISGHKKFKRRSIFHALNQKATARSHAKKIGKNYDDLNLIVAHLGGGISVGAHKKGRVVDVNNGLNGEGPFSPERAGTLPAGQLIELCFSGEYSQDQVQRMVLGEGGFVSYLGTNDAKEVEELAALGNKKAQFIQDALFYQVSKIIGEMAVVLDGKVDAILLTGGLAFNKNLESYVKTKTGFIAPVFVYPGEDELEALAMNALRVANGETEVKEYLK